MLFRSKDVVQSHASSRAIEGWGAGGEVSLVGPRGHGNPLPGHSRGPSSPTKPTTGKRLPSGADPLRRPGGSTRNKGTMPPHSPSSPRLRAQDLLSPGAAGDGGARANLRTALVLLAVPPKAAEKAEMARRKRTGPRSRAVKVLSGYSAQSPPKTATSRLDSTLAAWPCRAAGFGSGGSSRRHEELAKTNECASSSAARSATTAAGGAAGGDAASGGGDVRVLGAGC